MPSAQGHAMIITDTNARSEYVSPAPPAKYQPSPRQLRWRLLLGQSTCNLVYHPLHRCLAHSCIFYKCDYL